MSFVSSSPEILTQAHDGIFTITLNRPDKGHAYTLPMVQNLVQALKWADQTPTVRVVILESSGEHFCTGGDVKAMATKSEMFSGEGLELKQNYHFGIQEIPRQFERMQKPVISLIHGAAVGAGCDLVAMTDLRIATPEASFAETFCRVGLVPGDGGAYFLIRAVGYPMAMEMFMLGKTYTAEEALKMKLVHEIVSKNQLKERGIEVAKRISSYPPQAVWMTKRALIQAYRDQLPNHLEMMSSFQALTQRSHDHFSSLENLKNQDSRPYSGK
jgi:2-(1,2-epoxy-1,2-dihydrophenyl)acetyl-CoA isomerase